ncbi:MAG: hypothetical protein U9P71_07010, partial [Campylobacterota bacterium]|nr:hypothetical protein [Campylobacterota bacterium]
QIELSTPLIKEKAREVTKNNERVIDCYIFLKFTMKIAIEKSTHKFSKEATLNTKERIKRYFDYDLLLGGGVYGSTKLSDLNESYCDFNITKILEGE